MDIQPSPTVLDPRQLLFKDLYCNVDSPTFGNCYRAALKAGFTDSTARNLSHDKPKWYLEILGQLQGMQPEHLVAKLSQIINNPREKTPNKLRAIDMLMRFNRMYEVSPQNNVILNIQNVLD